MEDVECQINNIRQNLPKDNSKMMDNTKMNNMNMLNKIDIRDYMMNSNLSNDFTNINLKISFDASTGRKTVMEIKRTNSLEEMFKEYVKIIGISEDKIIKEIIFLYNGNKLDVKSKESVGNFFCKKYNISKITITVFDRNNITI